MPTLQELKGQRVLAKISGLIGQTDETGKAIPAEILRLVEIEDAGIWVESERFTKYLLTLTKLSTTPRSVVFFVPFAKIDWILSSADYPSLLEKSFGL